MKFNTDTTLIITLRLILAIAGSFSLFLVLMVPDLLANNNKLVAFISYPIVYAWLIFYLSSVVSWVINKPIINYLHIQAFGCVTVATLILGVFATYGFGLLLTGPIVLLNVYLIFWLIKSRDFILNSSKNNLFMTDEKLGDDL